MLRGLFNWKQPLAFFIVKSTIQKHELSIILDEILDALHETNLKVRAVVFDQAISNQSLAAERVSINEPFFIKKKNQKIYYFFDYLHLFKSIRNNLSKFDFSINSPVSWQDVILLWNLVKVVKVHELLQIVREAY